MGRVDGNIDTLDLETRIVEKPFPKIHQGFLYSLSILTSSGERLISSDYSGMIVLWDLKSKTALHKLEGHTSTIPAIVPLPGQSAIVSGSHDGSIRIWDAENGEQKSCFIPADRSERTLHLKGRTYQETVSAMLVVIDGRIIAGGWSGVVRVWDSTTSKLLSSWQAHFDGPVIGTVINNIMLHPRKDVFITTGTDGRVCLWDLATYSLLRTIKPLEHAVLPNAAAWNGTTFICGGKDGGGAANVCGAFNKIVTWDLAHTTLEDGVEDEFRQLGSLCEYVPRVWSIGPVVVMIVQRRGKLTVEIWTEEVL
ncbi:WD40 repeat-like protein [Tothia fuscella]|uniref:WD40 repeat-like protein n=1 Tax=Tothia fuscella TaxID=1048955 RepID=A0A9P4NXW8_9PEZI|nr:WD40 repeat-like protein [Tothia fuscella]